MGITARLENARISFANGLWTASSVEGSKAKFGADFICNDDTKVLLKKVNGTAVSWVPSSLDEVQKLARLEAFNGDAKKADTWFKALDARQRSVRDGNGKVDKSGDVFPGYEDTEFVVAKNVKRPPVRLADRTEVESAEESPIGSGDYVNAVVEFYAWTKPGQKGLFCSLLGTQYLRKGDSMGGGGKVAGTDDFEELTEGAGADDFS